MTGRPHRLGAVTLACAVLALLVPSRPVKSQSPAPDDKHGIVLNYPSVAAVPTVGGAATGSKPRLGLLPPRPDLRAAGALSGSAASRSPLSGLALNPPSDSRAPSSHSDVYSTRPSRIQFDMAPSSSFTPYIGLGLGGTGRLSDPMRPLGFATDPADSTRTYGGVAGFAYTLDKGTKLDFGYRFSNTQRPNVQIGEDVDSPTAERDRAAVLSLHYDLDLFK